MQVLRMPEVLSRIGLSRSTLWRLIRAGEFPRPIRLGRRSVGWIEYDVEAWIKSRSLTD